MQAMSERMAALRRLVAEVERGGEGFALVEANEAGAAPERAAGFRTAGPSAGRAPRRAASSGASSSALALPGLVTLASRARLRRAAPRIAFGSAEVDTVLGGGLERAGLHEIHAAGPGDETAATGFVAALCVLSLSHPSMAAPPAMDGTAALPAAGAGRSASAMTDAAGPHARSGEGGAFAWPAAPTRAASGDGGAFAWPAAPTRAASGEGGAFAWIETRFSAAEDGLLWPAGLDDLGLTASALIRVSVGRVVDALQAAEEALACAALTAVVLEIRGPASALDLVALRRLTLAARAHGRPCLLLRTGAAPAPTPALTRWSIAARPAAPAVMAGFGRRHMGLPTVAATLTRQRAGRDGAWDLQWCPDVACFRVPLPQSQISGPGDRPAEPLRRHA